MRRSRGLLRPLVACLVLVALLAIRGRLDVVEVRGRSMLPALRPGDRLVALRLRRAPRAGDVVLAPDPRDPSRELVKRIVAVHASGVTLRGDNPDFSTDARIFGAIPADRIRWRIVARYWPIGRAGLIRPIAAMRRGPLDEGAAEGGEPACAVPEALVAGRG
jgi:nickel-type superoxide dismutase maturation protease